MYTRKNGFTLVEMIVVMMVMIILMGLMLPAMLRISDAQGVESSAREVWGALSMARGLVTGSKDHYGVVFNNAVKKTVAPYDYEQTYENVDHWYMVVRKECGPGGCGNTPIICEGHDCQAEGCWTWTDGELENNIEGKLMELREGSVFSALSSTSGAGQEWYKYDKDNARWAWRGISNAEVSSASAGIHFSQMGSAYYNNTDGTIGIGKDGANMPKLRVYVESLTGLASVTRHID